MNTSATDPNRVADYVTDAVEKRILGATPLQLGDKLDPKYLVKDALSRLYTTDKEVERILSHLGPGDWEKLVEQVEERLRRRHSDWVNHKNKEQRDSANSKTLRHHRANANFPSYKPTLHKS